MKTRARGFWVKHCAVVALGMVAGVAIAQVTANAQTGKVNICHGTASAGNPYVLISVDAYAVSGHLNGTGPGHGPKNHPDRIAGPNGCTTPSFEEHPS